MLSARIHERSFKQYQITVRWMLAIVQRRGFYHLVEPVAVIKLNCLNKAFACQTVEWQNERVTHFTDQRKGERARKTQSPDSLFTHSETKSTEQSPCDFIFKLLGIISLFFWAHFPHSFSYNMFNLTWNIDQSGDVVWGSFVLFLCAGGFLNVLMSNFSLVISK